MTGKCPRVVIAGTAGDSGKSLVSLSLLYAWKKLGLAPACFKKGPDYIDAAWLSWGAKVTCRNLDSFLQSTQSIRASFAAHASPQANIIEGNRGLYDGVDVQGSHSTAALAKLLESPIILVVNARKVTRTVAAVVLGCLKLDPDVQIVGVIINRVAKGRHENLVTKAIEELTGLEVVGAIPKLKGQALPERHMGLVPPQEHKSGAELEGVLGEIGEKYLNVKRITELAGQAPVIPTHWEEQPSIKPPPSVKIGIFFDAAFTFYYPENLEALEQAGAELVYISGLQEEELPPVDALYIGGGFPESFTRELSENRRMHKSVQNAARLGMPIYAECGGLVYLARSLLSKGKTFTMANVLPLDLEFSSRPQGHGYVDLEVTDVNPLFDVGTRLLGHEFHYTYVKHADDTLKTAFNVLRGTGSWSGRDGFMINNVLAGYTHLHALGAQVWAPRFVDSAIQYRRCRILGAGQR